MFNFYRCGNISAPPADNNWSCRTTGSAPMAEGHLPWPVRRCGTLCLTIWEIRLLAVIASDARWKRFRLRHTETCSAFGVLRECAVQIYFYLLTYILLSLVRWCNSQWTVKQGWKQRRKTLQVVVVRVLCHSSVEERPRQVVDRVLFVLNRSRHNLGIEVIVKTVVQMRLSSSSSSSSYSFIRGCHTRNQW